MEKKSFISTRPTHSIELLQAGEALAVVEPCLLMPNVGVAVILMDCVMLAHKD